MTFFASARHARSNLIGGIICALACLALFTVPARAQTEADRETILFIGNSYTFAPASAVWHYRSETVTDLNNDGVGGMPALFKRFAEQSGLDYDVSLETAGGQNIVWHWENRRDLLDRPWDHVVIQDLSTFQRSKPGNPELLIEYGAQFAQMFAAQNPSVQIVLDATWSRPDQTYLPTGHWYGRSIFDMAREMEAGTLQAAEAHPSIIGIAPVGNAFSRAIINGIADPNPYDGLTYGQVDLWTYDHLHASTAGIYLESLVVFARITAIDPRTLGRTELAARDLGLSPELVEGLQAAAFEAVSGEPCERC